MPGSLVSASGAQLGPTVSAHSADFGSAGRPTGRPRRVRAGAEAREVLLPVEDRPDDVLGGDRRAVVVR